MLTLDKTTFLNEYHFTEDYLNQYGIDWDNLMVIYNDYLNLKPQLETQANYIADVFRKHKNVHTVKSRVKEPEHLVAKLIRKTSDRQEVYGKEFQFSVDNYRKEITDLIGVRVIHIFKEDWVSIHNFIKETWDTIEIVANIRDGDNKEPYENLGLSIKSRESGYRSVHYLVNFTPTRQNVIAEIQVRTIFEEGYGEIDHQLRYPSNNIPNVLALNLLVLNRLAGSADELSSVVKLLNDSWNEMGHEYKAIIEKKDMELKKLKSKIEKLEIDELEKRSLVSDISNILVQELSDDILSFSDKLKDITG